MEPCAGSVRCLPLRTPTLPPATHTNTYLLGEGELAVVDAASPYLEEQAALDRCLDALAARGERVVELLLTHHHIDHVSGTAHLAKRLGVPVAAHPLTAQLVRGRMAVSRELDEGSVLRYGKAEFHALFTPGHAPGHLVFFEPRSGALVAGDMVASVGTIIIDPPEGNMRRYLESLERLRALDGLRCILPAHGPPVEQPQQLLAFYLAHRLEREARVVAALVQGAATLEKLVPLAYPEVALSVYPLAARSLLAHLIKLRDEGRAVENNGFWQSA